MVDVALKKPKVGVEVAMNVVPRESVESRTLAGKVLAFVPPLETVRVPLKLESERHELEIEKHPLVIL